MNRRALGRWMPLLAVAALLVAGVTAAALSSPQVTRIPLPAERTPPPEAATAAAAATAAPVASDEIPGAATHQLPAWLTQVVAGLCLAFALAVVGMLVWYMVRDRVRVRSAPLVEARQAAAAGTEEVVAALDAGLERLSDSDADPRRAVIACWVRLEEAAAAAGTPRHPDDTSTELVARLLGAHRVSRPALDEFAAVYREARYATHGVDERMRASAVRSLGLLRDELTADRSEQTADGTAELPAHQEVG
ncbi:DUF4129 domain-containing protein [Planosporangium mesophilum]|uniref:Protein-glutamine gamma-glutamyltransferase-like C-terminal domain-containing protein n=1 Tax=Planosporangium mesophilum TaxID=689768 RepID=A0A8J3TG67_9ACTN|nr:DUF4129 domain-containing protein [Planosporangium mesophilum]NJC84845.1 DUF4129 domain-containing protein [Planosporangium mesophilum]GII24134.1 hypothetical protein Pme01_37310 [Planosporangium mesophilum]